MQDLPFLTALSRPQEARLIRGRLAEASGPWKLIAEAVDASLAAARWAVGQAMVFLSRKLCGSCMEAMGVADR